ncbi:MAG: type II toxin-antitoxin system Phd/YefM family antitoxin [Oscillospiraceae bacterium]|jgi:prevent-host-death family protein|nr:type II toxin-antitoxin system Phd/YefM family antitoxin [Oscillospiraceae bacterium]
MKTIPLAEAKTHFSAVMKDVEQGHEVAISYGKKRKTVAVIVPYEAWKKTKKRQLGTLKDRGTVLFSADYAMSDGELLGL